MGDVRASQAGEAHVVVGEVQDENGNYLPVKTAFAAPASSGNNAFLAAVTSRKLRVLWYIVQATGTVNVKFTDTAGSPVDLSPAWQFQAREGIVARPPAGAHLFESASGKGIQVNLSAAVAANVSMGYVEVP